MELSAYVAIVGYLPENASKQPLSKLPHAARPCDIRDRAGHQEIDDFGHRYDHPPAFQRRIADEYCPDAEAYDQSYQRHERLEGTDDGCPVRPPQH